MDDSDPVREPEIDAAVRQSHGLALTQLDADARRCLSAIAALGRKAWSRCGIGALDACAPGGDGTCTLCTEQFDGAGAARLVGALEHMCVAHAQRRLAAHVPQPARRRADAIPGPLFVVSPSKLGQYFNLGQCNRLLHQSTERGGGVADGKHHVANGATRPTLNRKRRTRADEVDDAARGGARGEELDAAKGGAEQQQQRGEGVAAVGRDGRQREEKAA